MWYGVVSCGIVQQMLCQELTTGPFFSLTMLHAPCPWGVITLLGVIPDTNVQDHPIPQEERPGLRYKQYSYILCSECP